MANLLRSRLRHSRGAVTLLDGYARKNNVFACVRLAQFRVYTQKPRSTFGKTASVFDPFNGYMDIMTGRFHLVFLRMSVLSVKLIDSGSAKHQLC